MYSHLPYFPVPGTYVNYFEMVKMIASKLVTFAEELMNFFTQPLGVWFYDLSNLNKVPLFGDFIVKISGQIMPYSVFDILGGAGITIILTLIIIKKVVPIA